MESLIFNNNNNVGVVSREIVKTLINFDIIKKERFYNNLKCLWINFGYDKNGVKGNWIILGGIGLEGCDWKIKIRSIAIIKGITIRALKISSW
jgi:hypothetical protein